MSPERDGPVFRFRCARTWDELDAIGGRPDVRYCDQCRAAVHRVRTAAQFEEHAAAGRCVAWQRAPERWSVGEPAPGGWPP